MRAFELFSAAFLAAEGTTSNQLPAIYETRSKLPAMRYARACVPLGSCDETDLLEHKTMTRIAGIATPLFAWLIPAGPMLLGHRWQRPKFCLRPSV
jgi:hypothetical protein